MNHQDEELDPLDLLAEEFTSALRRGDRPDIEEWAKRTPEHASAIRELFPTIVAMEGIKEATHASRPAVALPGSIDRLGDFRILREIGRGGMGVVYEAEQESLGRRVALKVLPPLRDPRRQRRFQRETRMAARLHHTNIVPIYGVGEAQGFSYYVMPVIRGVGLDVVIDALRDGGEHGSAGRGEATTPGPLTPTDAARALRTGWFHPAPEPTGSADASSTSVDIPLEAIAAATPPPPDPGPPLDPRAQYWRSVADIGRQVADALAHAHLLGVLHRDVKPANLLLDSRGVVWVTDFGLAKAVGHDPDLTHSGDLVGTLQYMAPEQLHGAYDARSDLHALGLTLYELLTLTPAYAAGDRGTLLKRVAESRPTPPGLVRHGIPRDLETIVLKATQADPDHRYRSAEELRTDLEAFLEDRPIRARRATAIEHAWRWCRRNKLVAGLAGVALIAMVGAAVTGWTAWATTSNALRREAAAADDARRASERAEANLALARKVFDGVFDRIAGPDRLELVLDETTEDDESAVINVEPIKVSEADAALLEQLLGFYDQFAARNAQDEDLRLDAAKAYRRVGDIQMQLGRIDAASDAYRRALATLAVLDGSGANHAVTIAAIHNDLGRAHRQSGNFEEARADHELALGLLAAAGDSASARFERARAHENLATSLLPFWTRSRSPDRRPTMQSRREGIEPAIEQQREAFRLYDELALQQPDNATIQLARVHAGSRLGMFLRRDVEGRQILQDTIARLEELTSSHPDVTAYRSELVSLYLATGMRRGPEEPSPELVTRTVELAEALAAEAPDDDDYRRMLASALTQRAERSLPREIASATAEQLALARADLERALSLDAESWFGRRTYIAVLDAQGETQLALAARQRWLAEMRIALERNPDQGGRMRGRLVAQLRALAREFRAHGADADAEAAEREADALDR